MNVSTPKTFCFMLMWVLIKSLYVFIQKEVQWIILSHYLA